MGIPPREVKLMTMWEYMACVQGWNRSQSDGKGHRGKPMTDDEYDALCEKMEQLNGTSRSGS